MRYLLLIFTLLTSLFYFNTAQAFTCAQAGSGTMIIDVPNPILVANSLVVGDLIGEYTAPKQTIFTCSDVSDVTAQYYQLINGSNVIWGNIDGKLISATGIAGIGYAYGGTGDECGNGLQWVSSKVAMLTLCTNTSGTIGTGKTFNFTPTIRLYKIGDISSTSSSSILLGLVSMFVNGKRTVASTSITLPTVTSLVYSCTLDSASASQNIVLDTVNTHSFSPISLTAGPTKDFNIKIQCDDASKVALTITGHVYSATRGLLYFDAVGNMPSGLVLQILRNGAAFPLNQSVNVGTTTQNSTFTIPLQARYYRISTSTPVTAGKVKVSTTFTLTYT